MTVYPSKREKEELELLEYMVMYEPNPDCDNMVCILVKKNSPERKYIYNEDDLKKILEGK